MSFFFFQAYSHEDPNMHPSNEAQLYGLVDPNVHQQVLASSSQVKFLLGSVDLESPSVDRKTNVIRSLLTCSLSQQEYASVNPETEVFRMTESNVHSQVLPSASKVAILHLGIN